MTDVYNRIADYDQYDDTTDSGRAFAVDLSKGFAAFPLSIPEEIDLDERRESLRTVPEQPHLLEAKHEYFRVKKQRGGKPKFYQLFGGPNDLEQLARYLGRSGQYAILYRAWSRTSHAGDLRRQLREGDLGSVAIAALRDPSEMLTTYVWAISFGLSGIRKMLEHHRPGEIERGTFRDWYVREVQDVYRALTEVNQQREPPDDQADK